MSKGQFVLEQDLRGKGLFLIRDWITVGPGISITLTLVPLGPVSLSLALRRRARLDPEVAGTESVVVAPDDLNQVAFVAILVLSSILFSAILCFPSIFSLIRS